MSRQKIKELYYNCNLMQLEHSYGVMYTLYKLTQSIMFDFLTN